MFANYTTLTTLEQIKKILESTQEYTRNLIKTNIMHRLESNILHHAKKQREQRKLKLLILGQLKTNISSHKVNKLLRIYNTLN